MDELPTPTFLHVLQLADGTLPIGRFAHSYGVEAWYEANPEAGPHTLLRLVKSSLLGSVATLDGAAVALAHAAASADDFDELRRIDAALTGRKLSAPARRASTLCGGRLAALADQLGAGEPAQRLAGEIASGATDGHLATVEGTLGAATGIPAGRTVLVSVRGHAAAVLSAAVRLGRLGAAAAQELLHTLAPEIERAARVAMGVGRDELRSTLPELDIHAARHERREARLFIT